MKKWFKSHYKAILSVLFCIAYYLLLFRICIDYIDFTDYRNEAGYNIKVAEFYFIVLPIAAVLPLFLYCLAARCARKNKAQVEPPKQSNCLIPAYIEDFGKYSGFYILRRISYEQYWCVISKYIDSAIEYMLCHQEEFYVTTDKDDKPNLEGVFCETMYINGKTVYVYMKTKTFMISLKKCVEHIKKTTK